MDMWTFHELVGLFIAYIFSLVIDFLAGTLCRCRYVVMDTPWSSTATLVYRKRNPSVTHSRLAAHCNIQRER